MAPVVSIFCICDALILSIYDIYTTKILSLFYSTYVLAVLSFWRATLKIKELWKKDPKFAKWFKRNVLDEYTKASDYRYYPSKFRGEYGPKD